MALITYPAGPGKKVVITDIPAPKLDPKVNEDVIARQTEIVVKNARGEYVHPDTMLGIVPVMPYIPRVEHDLNIGTIVPLFDERIPVNTIPQQMMSMVPDSKFSPAPGSIFGSGSAAGTIMVYLGKRLIAEIAAEIGFEGLKRIGQRVVAGARIRGRTASNPENIGRHVTVVAENQHSGFLPNRKHYDGPCEWWEFWCWIV